MNKSIKPQAVRHIAKLGRIELAEEQVEALGDQLASILEYFNKLQELDTDNVEPLVHPVELSNVLADDVVGSSLTPEKALANAPERDENFFKVPKVIGDS